MFSIKKDFLKNVCKENINILIYILKIINVLYILKHQKKKLSPVKEDFTSIFALSVYNYRIKNVWYEEVTKFY